MSYASFRAFQDHKEHDSLGQSGNSSGHDFLDQFLTFDTVDLDSSTFLNAPLPMLSVKAGGGSESTSASFTTWEDEARLSSTYSSGGEVVDTDAALHDISKGTHFRSGKSRRASDLDLLSLEDISLQSPQLDFSPPSSPQLFVAETVPGRRRFLERITKPFRREPNNSGQIKSSPIRKATSPAKMMRTSQYNGASNIPDWERFALDASKFEFGFQNGSRPISPPLCPRVSDVSEINNNNGMISSTQGQNNFGWDHPLPQSYSCHPPTGHISPMATPPADVATFQQANTIHTSTHNLTYTSPHRHHASASWAQAPANTDFSFDTSTGYSAGGESTPLWYSNTGAVHLAQPSPSNFSRSSRNNNTNLAMQLQAELAYKNELALSQSTMSPDLMIQNLPDTAGQQSFIVDSLLGQEQNYFAQVGSAASQHPPQPQAHHPRYSQSQPQNLLSEYASPKMQRDKSQMRTESSSSPSPKSRSASFHVSKKRSRSFSRKRNAGDTAGVAKTSKATGGVDFVNFTPDDSMKILTGVAPSGSSKTKARREKEAMEKTRRLSQAAVRAVQAAGGSIETLVEQGLIIPPLHR